MTGSKGWGSGEDTLSKMSSKVSGLEHGKLVRGVEGVDEGRLWRSVIVVFILVLLWLSNLILQLSLGTSLATAGNVSAFQNSAKGPLLVRNYACRIGFSYLNPLTPAEYLTVMVLPFSSM